MQKKYPDDRFEGFMRHMAIDKNDTTVTVQAGQPTPPDIRWVYLPRIRCNDCPGKLYTPGPDETINNFEVHLKNRMHRDKVTNRVEANAADT